ncbi:MAG: DNA polymerase IV [Proteobacteria bacterium]|nr:DNA polymerase IV [Pseudomonadota bacterium]
MADSQQKRALQRKILHVDADSFYASVEMRERPELRGKAIAVGGNADRRGVIATSSYEARKFGVRSAMASSRALVLCPQLIIVAPRFELYKKVSRQFHQIFRDYSALIEPLSLDEAFLDVSECPRCCGSATRMAEEILARVRDELQLTVSAGVAPNKFLAKVASDWNKPNGVFTIPPNEVAQFVRNLPVSKINGVGKVTAENLQKMGVVTCADLQAVPLEDLLKRFGKYGKRLSEVARGIDNRPVQPSRVRKSISVEHTFPEDIAELPAMLEAMDGLVEELGQRFAKIEQHYFPVKRVVKIKYRDFTQTTLEEAIGTSGENWCDAEHFRRLIAAAWPRGAKPVRLLGAGLRLQPSTRKDSPQLPLV